ncbi:MAG: hypothetical protein HN531_14005 [Opitutae bacterium]|jgi:hypothetical protein|nr:hypothetical protein [Opitutae bacterium]
MADFLRGDDEEVASFFAFQDVITAVLGILILIALQLSFSINVVKGEEGNKESTDDTTITEEEFLDHQSKRKNLEVTLSQLRERNRELMRKKQAILSSGQSAKGLENSLEILRAEVEQLTKDYNAFLKTLAQKEKTLREEANKLGLSSVQDEVSELLKKSEKEHKEIAALKRKIEDLNSRLSDSMNDLSAEKSKRNSLWMIPERSDDGKDPLLVTIDDRNMRFEEFDKPESLRVLRTSSLTSSFKSGVESYSTRRFKIVFLFKPSGAHYFKKIIELAKELGFEVGYDPIEESQKVIFSLPD